jgi:tetratricopeptide (TPR) repeat protein
MSAACLAAGDLGTPPAVTRGRLASCVCWQSGAPPYLRSCETETRSKCSGQNQTSDAIRIFQLNVELDPDWANTYDRLGEACKAAGDKAQAVKNDEKSLSIPQNTSKCEECGWRESSLQAILSSWT